MKRTRNHPYIHGWRGIRPKKRGPRPKSGLKDCQSSQLPQVRHYLLSFLLWQQLDHPLRWMSTHQSRFPKPKKLESICTMSTLGVKRWGLNQIFFFHTEELATTYENKRSIYINQMKRCMFNTAKGQYISPMKRFDTSVELLLLLSGGQPRESEASRI